MASRSVPMPASANAATSAVTWPAVPTPMVSPRLSWLAPRSSSRRADGDDLLDRDGALPRVAEAHRDVGPHVETGLAGPRRTVGSNIANCSSRVRLRFLLREGLGRAAEDRDVPAGRARGPGRGRARWARAPGGRGPRRRARSSAPRRRRAAAPSAGARSWSPRRSAGPAASRRRMNSALTSVGTSACSFCRPSRGTDLVDRHALGQAVAADGHRQRRHVDSSTANSAAPSATWSPVAASTVGDRAGERRLERELHLHRLHHAEHLTLGHVLALGDSDRRGPCRASARVSVPSPAATRGRRTGRAGPKHAPLAAVARPRRRRAAR